MHQSPSYLQAQVVYYSSASWHDIMNDISCLTNIQNKYTIWGISEEMTKM